MFNKLLVPTDGSALSNKAVHAAVEFAKEKGSEIVAVSVAEPYIYPYLAEGSGMPLYSKEYDQGIEEAAKQWVGEVAELARANGVPCKTVTKTSLTPHEEIIKAARQFNCDGIFMASHGRKGMAKLFLGSETQKVLTHSPVPVLVFR